MPAIILMAVWKNFGYNMLIFIAGLQAIPQELYDAAEIDGAGPMGRFFNVTLPMLGPTLLFVGVITMIGYFQLFSEPYVMTQGGPLRSTTSVVLHDVRGRIQVVADGVRGGDRVRSVHRDSDRDAAAVPAAEGQD